MTSSQPRHAIFRGILALHLAACGGLGTISIQESFEGKSAPKIDWVSPRDSSRDTSNNAAEGSDEVPAAEPRLVPKSTGATWFVAVNGDDANAGDDKSRPLRTVQEAIVRSNAGDTILLRAGIHTRFRLTDYHKNAPGIAPEDARWLTIASYPGERAIVDGQVTPKTHTAELTGAYPIRISGASFVAIERLEVTHSGTFRNFTCDPVTNTACPCSLDDPSCQKNAEDTSTQKGILLDGLGGGNAKTAIHHLVIRGCEIHHNGGTAIIGAVGSYGIQVLDNHLHHNGVRGLAEGYGTYIEGTGHWIKGNVSHDNSGNGFRFGNTNLEGSHHLVDSVIEQNFAYDNGGRFWHSNDTMDGGAGIVLWGGHGNIIRNNVAAYNREGIHICGQPKWSSATGKWANERSDNLIANNTSYGSDFYGFQMDGSDSLWCKTGTDRLVNNIAFATRMGRDLNLGIGNTASNNLIGIDPRFETIAPRLAAEFKIQSASPARDKGVNLSAITTDFFGGRRPVGVSTDIGAHEFAP